MAQCMRIVRGCGVLEALLCSLIARERGGGSVRDSDAALLVDGQGAQGTGVFGGDQRAVEVDDGVGCEQGEDGTEQQRGVDVHVGLAGALGAGHLHSELAHRLVSVLEVGALGEEVG